MSIFAKNRDNTAWYGRMMGLFIVTYFAEPLIARAISQDSTVRRQLLLFVLLTVVFGQIPRVLVEWIAAALTVLLIGAIWFIPASTLVPITASMIFWLLVIVLLTLIIELWRTRKS